MQTEVVRTAEADAFRSWLTKEDAAKILGVSVKSIERRIADGQLRTQKKPRRGGHPLTMINPDDFAAMASAANVTEIAIPSPTRADAQIQLIERVPEFVDAIAAAIRPEPPAINLDLEAAERASGLPRRLLLRAIREGRLAAHAWSGAYYIHREDLAAFRPAAAPQLAWTKDATS